MFLTYYSTYKVITCKTSRNPIASGNARYWQVLCQLPPDIYTHHKDLLKRNRTRGPRAMTRWPE